MQKYILIVLLLMFGCSQENKKHGVSKEEFQELLSLCMNSSTEDYQFLTKKNSQLPRPKGRGLWGDSQGQLVDQTTC